MITKEDLISELYNHIEQSGHTYNLALMNHALTLAILWHDGQFRSSGEEFVCHPIQVAMILVDLGMDNATVAAAILHDTVEDTSATIADIKREFGDEIASLVDGVTKIDKISFDTWEEAQAENIRKILFALSKDARVIIIKLADRVHNMRTIDAVSESKRLIKAKETLDVYAPIAHRLGMQTVKDELEDLSLRALDPHAYHEIEKFIEHKSGERKIFLDTIQDKIRDALIDAGIDGNVTGRLKSIASTYRKTFMSGRNLEEVYDIFAVRIIVDTIPDCYNALGIIHELFHPISGRFKDYIATPKGNMYQSLHTTVIGTEKMPFEVQIRTKEMHYTAEYGIASHWKYKAGISGKDSLDERLNWVRHFIENQQDGGDDAAEFMQNIKTDLSPDEVIAFTPKGDTICLPNGSTAIDFAYAIHTAVGHRMVGAKVDNHIVPLSYQIQSGQIVEILTTNSENHGPSRDWLQVAKTSEARSRIRSWFKKEKREENILHGKTELEREMSRNLLRLPEGTSDDILLEIAKKFHMSTLDDFYAALGYGGIMVSRVIPHVKDAYIRVLEQDKSVQEPEKYIFKDSDMDAHAGVVIDGIHNCLVKFAHCCNPIPGDEIIGYLMKMGGCSIHKRDCNNVPKDISLAPEPGRWIGCHWEESLRTKFNATVYILVEDRPGILADITNQLFALRLDVHSIVARESGRGEGNIETSFTVNSVEHLQTIMKRIGTISGVISIRR